ncbi:MAG: hypothetical protein V4787_24090 [Pseudomonadota bacterium]
MSILVPLALPNPFDLRYVRDDVHVIAFFTGHLDYESVEAMIAFQEGGAPRVRATLTLHDQTQVDHVNDPELLAQARAGGRDAVARNIDAVVNIAAKLPSAHVSFLTHRNEPIAFDVVCASPPDERRGGINDPGDHASGSSLPVMLRGGSAMGSAASRVRIAGADYFVPEKLRAGPHFVGHHAYFTLSHHMAIVVGGTRRIEVVAQPETLSPGAIWVLESTRGRKTYTLLSRSPDDAIVIRSDDGAGETLHARIAGDQLELDKVTMDAGPAGASGMVMSFGPDASFAIGVDSVHDAVAGAVVQPRDDAVSLLPRSPAWAVRRAVHARWTRVRGGFDVECRIGTQRDPA